MTSVKKKAGKAVSITWKILIFIFSFAIVLFVSLRFRMWSGDFTMYFLRTQNWGMIAFLLIIGTGVSMILTKLLQWQFRLETKPVQKQRRRLR